VIRTLARAAGVLAPAIAVPLLLNAQQPPAAPAAPDSPAVVQQIAALKAKVGPRWEDAVRFWCEAPRANRPDDPAIEPTQVFDNVYAIGSIGTVAYVIRSSAGLLMIDALSANEVETRLLPRHPGRARPRRSLRRRRLFSGALRNACARLRRRRAASETRW
jgi:hypothetical protein